MIKATFRRDYDVVIEYAEGHKEITKEFETQEELDSFLERIENEDETAIEELEDSTGLQVDNVQVDSYQPYGDDKWKLI